MNGTEKQVKWAKEIVAQNIEMIEKLMSFAEKRGKTEAMAEFKKDLDFAASIREAAFVIKYRSLSLRLMREQVAKDPYKGTALEEKF